MLKKRIIPCLDVRDGRVVKGKQFQAIVDVDDPVKLSQFYTLEGADELVFYDITASFEKRKLRTKLIENIAAHIAIPFTVGGGINTMADIESVLLSGADKVSLNSGALANPLLITEGARRFGSQCIVVSIDVKLVNGVDIVFTLGGRQSTGKEAVAWAKEVVGLGAGEIVVNAMDNDGMQQGFHIRLLNDIQAAVNVPVIASGGAGSINHFIDLATKTHVEGYLAASVFHYQTIRIKDLKNALKQKGVMIR
jgi:cyclase